MGRLLLGNGRLELGADMPGRRDKPQGGANHLGSCGRELASVGVQICTGVDAIEDAVRFGLIEPTLPLFGIQAVILTPLGVAVFRAALCGEDSSGPCPVEVSE